MPGNDALIAAASSATGNLVNTLSTGNMNRRSMRFSQDMYNRQKNDNIEFWNMQNNYNSPQAQMARFQAAGLNPNLIYGQGNSGNAGSISTPDVQTPQFRSPEWGNVISGGGFAYINSMYDLEIKQAQVDNMKLQGDVIKEDAVLKRAQALSTMTNEERARFNLDFESELRPVSADARREQLRQMRTSTDLSINEDARRATANASSLMEAAERMLTMKSERTLIPYRRDQMSASTAESYERIRQMKLDGTLKKLDIELKEQGIQPGSPIWATVAGRIMSGGFKSEGLSKIQDGLNSILSRFGIK